MPSTSHPWIGGAAALLLTSGVAVAQTAPRRQPPAQTSSLMEQALRVQPTTLTASLDRGPAPGSTQAVSLFYVVPEEGRTFQKHDLIQIIVREQSRAISEHELEAGKAYRIGGDFEANLFDNALRVDPSSVDGRLLKDFQGEAEYERRDDLVTRVSAEVIEVLPNGNLVLEAKTVIQLDEEVQTIKVTGVCRPDDVTSGNTVLSTQVHNLKVEKMHEGELKKANQKGVLAKFLDFIFAW